MIFKLCTHSNVTSLTVSSRLTLDMLYIIPGKQPPTDKCPGSTPTHMWDIQPASTLAPTTQPNRPCTLPDSNYLDEVLSNTALSLTPATIHCTWRFPLANPKTHSRTKKRPGLCLLDDRMTFRSLAISCKQQNLDKLAFPSQKPRLPNTIS